MAEITDVKPERFIKEALREQGRSIRRLADRMDWTRHSLYHSLAERRTLSPERRRTAARILGIPSFIVDGWDKAA